MNNLFKKKVKYDRTTSLNLLFIPTFNHLVSNFYKT